MTDNSKYGSITQPDRQTGETQTDNTDIMSQISDASDVFERPDRSRIISTAQTISTMTDPENNQENNKFQELKEGLSLDKIRILKFGRDFEEEWENLTTRASKLINYLLSSLRRMFDHDRSLMIALLLLLFTANLGVSYYVAFFPQVG